jgi:hypothetical protein
MVVSRGLYMNEFNVPAIKPRIFLAHAYRDRDLVQRVAEDLQARGAYVTLDEATMFMQDSLHERLEQTIGKEGYIAVALSSASLPMNWVQHDLQALAQSQAWESRIIPMLAEGRSIPDFLEELVYADFTRSGGYQENLDLIIRRLGLPDYLPSLKGWGAAVPVRDEQFRSCRLLTIHLTIFNGERDANPNDRVTTTHIVPDTVRVGELVTFPISRYSFVDLTKVPRRYLRARIDDDTRSILELRPQRRFESQDVRSGDFLIAAIGKGNQADSATILRELGELLTAREN